MIFSTGQVVYCLCYSLFLNSNNDIFPKIMANFSEVSYLALNIFSAIKASQFNFNNRRFKEFISDIYPKELTVSETTESTSVASYLDLLFT